MTVVANDFILVEIEGNTLCFTLHNLVGEPYSKPIKTQMNTQLSTCNEGKELSTNMKIIIPEGQGVLGYCGVLNGLLRSHHTWS